MIKLKDILFEIEIGKDFLTDPNSQMLRLPRTREAYKKFLDSIGREIEPNTEDEDKLLKAISAFINGGGDRSMSWISWHTNDLMALKSKYPKMLDPTSDTGKYGNKLYRAMNVKADVIREAIQSAGGIQQSNDPKEMLTIPYTGTVKMVMDAVRNTFSLTFDYDMAAIHLSKYTPYNDYTDSVRCIVETNVQTVNSNLLMAPSFLNVWAWDESETWYVGKDPMKCTAIHIPQGTLSQIM